MQAATTAPPASAVDTLVDWLATRPAADLAALMACRPDAIAERPNDLVDLAEALHAAASLRLLIRRLNRPQLQVLTGLAALGQRVAMADLAALFGRAADDPELLRVVVELAEVAAIAIGSEAVYAPADLRRVIPQPLRLGSPVVPLLAGLPLDAIRRIAHRLGVSVPARKGEAIEALAAWYHDPDGVRRLLAKAPDGDREQLEALAWRGPAFDVASEGALYAGRLPSHLVWAVDRGLLIRSHAWGLELELPAEVGLAIRGPDWRAPFEPASPDAVTTVVDVAAVEREAGAAAATALDHATAVLSACDRTPIAMRKAGGIAVRELKRTAKEAGLDPVLVEMWLALGMAAGLLAVEEYALLPTDTYDDWVAEPPHRRLATLVWHWWTLTVAPTYRRGHDAPAQPEIATLGGGPRRLRAGLLATLAGFGEGHAGDLPAVLAATGWRSPIAVDGTTDPHGIGRATVHEATLLGLIAHGAATSVARSLLSASQEDEPIDAVAGALGAILPGQTDKAIFQADLTALVPGLPAEPVAAVLNAAAVRESRGQAAQWRFTTASVRSALDAGWSAEGLTEALTSIARDGALPQPLRYLLGDLGRQHGRVQVRAVGCVLIAADEALAAELVAAAALRRLGLTALSSVVIGAAADAPATLAALRTAGYAPIGLDPAGNPVIERAESRRVTSDVLGDALARIHAPAGVSPPDAASGEPLLTVAERLLARSVRPRAIPIRPAHDNDLGEYTLDGDDTNGEYADGDIEDDDVDGDNRDEDDRVVVRGVRWGAPRQLDLVGPGRLSRPTGPADPRLAVELAAARLAPRERDLLVNAMAEAGTVRIGYQDSSGNRTNRIIEPTEVMGRVLVAWCHLRQEERHFSLDRITSVRSA